MTQYPHPQPQTLGGAPNWGASPGDVNVPQIFEPTDTFPGYTFPQVWIALSGENANYGGCHVWLSLDDVSYSQIGGTAGQNAQGTLTASLGYSSDPDTTDTLSIDLSESQVGLPAATQQTADQYLTLVVVDQEVIAYGTITPGISNGLANLTYLRRGLFGSGVASHAAGAPVARFDATGSNVFSYQIPPNLILSTVFLKFTAFNIFGKAEQSLADVSPYLYQINGNGFSPTTSPIFGPLLAGSSVDLGSAAVAPSVYGSDAGPTGGTSTGTPIDLGATP